MKKVLSALAVVTGLSLFAAQSALAFSVVTVDASGPDGSAQFRGATSALTDSKAKQPDGGANLFQSSDGRFTVRAQVQGSNGFGNNGFGFGGMNATSRKNFSDYIPPP